MRSCAARYSRQITRVTGQAARPEWCVNETDQPTAPAPPVASLFAVLTSPRTTIGLGIVMMAVLSAGLFVPQLVSPDVIHRSYETSFAQFILGFELHRIGASWLFQLVSILLGLNIVGMFVSRSLGLSAQVPADRNADLEHGPFPGPNEDEGIDVALAAVAKRWSISSTGPNSAIAKRGFVFEGLMVAAIGLAVLTGAWVYSQASGFRGTIELMAGDDQVTRSYFSGKEIRHSSLLPWRPPFEMACMPTPDGTLLAPRECRLLIDGEPKRVTLTAGHDIEFNGYRLSLTGIRRAPDVSGYELDLAGPSERTRMVGSVAQPVDVTHAGKRLGTIILSGTSATDPIAAFPAEGVAPSEFQGLSASVRSRVLLTLTVTTTEHVGAVWAGVTVFLIGLLFASLLPSYHIVATRRGALWRLRVTGRGLSARPLKVAESLSTDLAARVNA
ncbi:MAG: hypothetical protein ACI9OJ_001494 [Myxococcota bacterium]|jgi:hypothetical protein